MRLTLKEKVAYGLGAVGKDMVYMLSASYVLYYYQDILGVSAIAMGIILMIARVFDAFNDPLMGVVVAKTKTKWGKFRPWLMIGTVTNALILIVMFAAPPSLDGGGLVAYAAVIYILWGITYTMMDIPYWSMIPAFTEGGKEREGLTTLARSAAGVGSAVISILTVMCVAALGNAFSSGESKMITNVYQSDEASVYVMETDENNNPTGNVFEYPLSTVNVEITGTDKIFEGIIDVSDSNAVCTGTAGRWDISGYGVEFVKGDYADEDQTEIIDTEPVLVISVPSDVFMEMAAASSMNVDIAMKSNLEVERVGFKYFSIIVGILFVVFITITCIFVKEKSTVDIETPSVKQMFKALLDNDQAMTIVITIVLVNSATYITSNLLIYFFKYDLAGSDWTGNYTLFNMFSGGIQIIAMMFFFPILRKAFNTLKIFYISVFSAIGGYVILLFMALAGLKSVYPFFVPGFFIMSAVGMLNVAVTIFLANTVDYGDLKNNRRDESVIFSMQTFVVKLASGIAALIASICLAVFNIKQDSEAVITYSSMLEKIDNYRNNVVETISSGSVVGLRLVMTLAPIIVLIVALLIFKKRYILTDSKLEEISRELKSREA
jgi:Na+/melibiose symporter-like transporter